MVNKGKFRTSSFIQDKINKMVNIRKLTENFILSDPIISSALERNIINYSKLARIISKEKNIKQTDAIVVACRRIKTRLKKSSALKTLKKSKKKIEIDDKKAKIILSINKNHLNEVMSMIT